MNTPSSFTSDISSEQFIENHDASVEILGKIVDSFPQTRSGDIIYPEYFGGKYIGPYGHITILVVDDDTLPNEIIDILGDEVSSTINVRQVEFSHATLHHILDVMEYITNGSYQRLGVKCVYIRYFYCFTLDTINNRVTVRVLNLDYIDYFRKTVIDHPAVEFIPMEYFFDEWMAILQRVYGDVPFGYDDTITDS